MDDWEEESPSDGDDVTKIENELYSMFYYHSMSDGLPDDLSKKYSVDNNEFGATISLKDSSANEQSTNSRNGDDVTLENDNTSSSERYVDRGKGNSQIISNAISVNDYNGPTSKKLLAADKHSAARLTKHLPGHGTVSKFQSFRYFYEGNRRENFVKNNHRSINSMHKLNNSSNKLIHKHKNPLSSTPVAERNLSSNEKITKTNTRVKHQQVIANIEDKVEVIDLTQEPPKKQMKVKIKKKILKNQRNTPVITVSSESETESDEESDSTDSDSDYFEEETFKSLLLNTSMPIDRSVCDISDINLNYDWEKTSSPEGWTRSMRKFYNKPSKKLLHFDYQAILKEMREQGEGEWGICNADLYKLKSSRRIRCLRCQEEGHVKANCSKVFSCHMCGMTGHTFKKCPNNICLKCGSKCRGVFPRSCANCANDKNMTCSYCGITGHSSKLCTAAWHSITSGNNEDKRSKNRKAPKYCCNCGESGHCYEDCRKAYSSHVSGKEVVNSRKAERVKHSNFKHKNNFRDMNFHLPNNQTSKFKTRAKIRSNIFKTKNYYNNDGLSICPSLKNAKKRCISKRILMLRRTNKKNKTKASHPHTL